MMRVGLRAGLVWLAVLSLDLPQAQAADEPKLELEAAFTTQVQPLLRQYCLSCHAEQDPKGELDLARFDSLARVRQDPKPWTLVIEQLEAGEMPPKDKPQPT